MELRLEIAIPTYNRCEEISKCLESVKNALTNITPVERARVSVSIRNNSTKGYSLYEELIERYRVVFEELGLGGFQYIISGFNVGAENNIAGLLCGSHADYVWFLPDDDIARFDSLAILLKAIDQYRPCFLAGGWEKKSVIKYNTDDIGFDDGVANMWLDPISNSEKISVFLSKNVVQAQEYVYKVSLIKDFIKEDENVGLLNPMLPGLFAIYCLQDSAPFVRFSRSLGVFRDGDPRSGWRHLWYRYALQDWPRLSEQCFKRGWLNKSELTLSINVFSQMIDNLATRPDIYLGINRRFDLSFFELMRFHKKIMTTMLMKSSKAFFVKLSSRITEKIWFSHERS